MRRLLIMAVLLSLHAVGSAVAQTASTGTKTIADRVAGLRKLDGYVPLYWDEASGRLLLEISRFDQEFLYQVSLAAGVGSNPVGLDRGQVGPSAAVRFERVGPKVLLVQTNYGFRALGALWDNGPDPIDALKQQIQVRRLALARFGLGSLPDGLPLSLLESRLLPIYLLHRYQVNAAAKSVGGAMFTYSVKTATGPSPTPVLTIVSPERQRAALATLLETIAPPFLALPSKLLELIPPTAYGYGTGTAEPFARRTSAVFDSIGAATIAADFAVSALLQPERAARLIEFHGRSDLNPDFDEVVAAIVTKAFGASAPAATPGAIARAVQELVATRLTELASNDAAAFEVRAGARQALRLARGRLSARTDAAGVVLRQTIDQFLSQPTPPAQTAPLPTPQGEPIG